MEAILIFDNKCKECQIFASGGKRGKIIPLGYTTPEAKKLMKAQFKKNYGFTLMLFTKNEVFWGPSAAKETVRVAYASRLQNIMYHVYPFLVKFLNVRHKRTLLPSPPSMGGKKLPNS